MEEGKACRCVVPDDQLSLAIGKEGQNARLAARLTGYKIDIKPVSYQEPEEDAAEETSPEEISAEEETQEPRELEKPRKFVCSTCGYTCGELPPDSVCPQCHEKEFVEL